MDCSSLPLAGLCILFWAAVLTVGSSETVLWLVTWYGSVWVSNKLKGLRATGQEDILSIITNWWSLSDVEARAAAISELHENVNRGELKDNLIIICIIQFGPSISVVFCTLALCYCFVHEAAVQMMDFCFEAHTMFTIETMFTTIETIYFLLHYHPFYSLHWKIFTEIDFNLVVFQLSKLRMNSF